MEKRFSSFRRLVPGIIFFLCVFCVCHGTQAAAPAQKPGELLVRTMAELFQHANRNTRLAAYFVSAGLPDRIEHTQVLRQQLAGADAVERITILYALAVMTRAPADVDAFLYAFPEDMPTFFELMIAERALSNVFNSSMADFLLVLVHEDRTREAALPHLGRIVVNSDMELMNIYREDAVAGPYIKANAQKLFFDLESSRVDIDSGKYDRCEDTTLHMINDIINNHNADIESVAASLLMRTRMSGAEIWNKYSEIGRKQVGNSMYLLLVPFCVSNERFIESFPHDQWRIDKMLKMEKRLYRPPLGGITGTLWQLARPVPDAQTLQAIKAVWSYGKVYLEACEVRRLQSLMKEE